MIGLLVLASATVCSGPAAVCTQGPPAALSLIAGHAVPRVITDPHDSPAVTHASAELRGDLLKLAGRHATSRARVAVIVGTIGHNAVIDRLVREHRIDATAIGGRWEAFLQQVIDHPMPGIDRALIIAGADRRGAVFGAYDLSRRAGVSPWAWWADVPVPVRSHLVVLPGIRTDSPKVRYRGIFLNDEDPALKGWATARFGGLNHRFYAHVFDLILRLKGNYLWPAMWGKSLWEDDPQSAALAQRMGIVLSTSHHEPMMRAQEDWHRANGGAWDYTTNGARLRQFWRKGIERNLSDDKVVTIGMRGDGDKPMTEGTAIPLLEHIVADQRKIIAQVTGKPAAATPQVWALYKEVQDYYDQGMKVPDDVTLLFSDDNWGNIRRLPEPGDTRAGGYGIYYHFDYVGGPRSYRWLNVTQIGRVWQQMETAYARGVDRIWITNVGDLKPMEVPTSFFLDLAWNPDAYGPDAGTTYVRAWAAEQFGPDHAAEIADILDRETRFAARRTPELTNADTWTLDTEWPQVIAGYDRLVRDAEQVSRELPAADQDAYFELVLHPVLATANLDRLYYTVARNRRAAVQGSADTNALADEAARYFARDKALARRYEAAAGGKWPHMMDQTHIGYIGWDSPKTDIMPAVSRIATRGESVATMPHAAPVAPTIPTGSEFVEHDGTVAIDAVDGAAEAANGAHWVRVAGLGRTGAAMTTLPMTATFESTPAPTLTFLVLLGSTGSRWVTLVAAPSLPTSRTGRIRCRVTIDGGPPMIVDLTDDRDKAWAKAVIAHASVVGFERALAAGRHVVRVQPIDAGVVFERLVLSQQVVDPLALDPPESPRG